MASTLKSLVAFLASLIMLAAAVHLLQQLLVGDKEQGLRVSLESAPVLMSDALVFTIAGDLERVDDPAAMVELDVDASRGERSLAPGSLEPGLHVLSWSERYMGRAGRDASFSVLSGPFAKPGEAVPCGIGLSLGIGVFDPLVRRLENEVRAALGSVPMLPGAARVSVSPYFVEGGLDVLLEVGFREGSSLNARVPLEFTLDSRGDLVLNRRAEVDATVRGALGAMAAFHGGGLSRALETLSSREGGGLSGAMEAAREAGGRTVGKEIAAQVDSWLPVLNEELSRALPRELDLRFGESRLVVGLSVCAQPASKARSLFLSFDARLRLLHASQGSKRLRLEGADGEAIGPVLTRGEPISAPMLRRRDEVSLSISEDLFNFFFHEAWLVGLIDDLIGGESILKRLGSEMRGALSLAPTSIELDLPPVLRFEEDALRVRAGELRIGTTSGESSVHTDIVAYLDGYLDLGLQAESLSLSARPSAFGASCSHFVDGVDVRRPCLFELLQEVELRFLGKDLGMKLEIPLGDILEDLPVRLEDLSLRDGSLDLVFFSTGLNI